MTKSLSLGAIHSVPRSGSSWLGEIINSSSRVTYKYQPLFSYEFKSAVDEATNEHELRAFFNKIAGTRSAFLDQSDDRKKGLKPDFVKNVATHVIYKEVRYHYVIENCLRRLDNFKAILLVRCPLAVLDSFRRAPREFRADLGWDFESEWRFAQSKNENRREDYFGYEKWKEAALLFTRLKKSYPKQVYLISYNDLLSNPLDKTSEIYDFLNLSLEAQTKKFIANSKQEEHEDTYSVYKNRVRDLSWRDQLSESIVNYVQSDLKASELRRFLSEA